MCYNILKDNINNGYVFYKIIVSIIVIIYEKDLEYGLFMGIFFYDFLWVVFLCWYNYYKILYIY